MPDPELEAMAAIAAALESLPDDEARGRVISWASSRFVGKTVINDADDRPAERLAEFRSLGELIDRAQPSSRADRALLIGFWMHMRGEADFTGQSVNDELKNLGDPAPNITDLMTSIIARRPAPVRQTRRMGSGRQARKRYALTEIGRTGVQAMLRGNVRS